MGFLIVLLNVMIITITIWVVIRDNKRGKTPLFSLRNVFLFGLLYFQSFGLFSWILDRPSNGWWYVAVRDAGYETSMKYVLMLMTFLLFFLAVYRIINFRLRPRPLDPVARLSPLSMAHLAILLTLVAIVIWLAGRFGLKDLLRFISSGIGITATGAAAWAWCDRRRNPFFLVVLIGVALVNTAPHLTEYGRRGLVSIAGIVAWVMFYRIYFRFNPTKILIVSLIIAIPALVLLAAFSEARVKRPDSVRESIDYMMHADINKGLRRLATFQGSAPISIWCIENYPIPYSYRHMYTPKAFCWFFIPRSVWPGKPPGLGISIPRQAGMKRVGGLNVGAGLIGHASAEGGWYAVIVYAFLLAIGLKLTDSILIAWPSPLYRITFAAALGDLFATCRGEVNYFLDIVLMSTVSGFVAMYFLARFFSRRPQ
jgi:hypothetical protein